MTATTQPRPTSRVPYWDNAKWLAVVLVVVGHVVQPLALDSDVALVPYLVIYAFHMPFFGVISGYFTTAEPGPKQYGRIIGDLLVPYVIFEVLWSVVRSLISGSWSIDPVTPSWTLWFLLALAAFRVALPVLARLRWPLLWVTLLAILVGYVDDVDQTFSMMRAIQMLPFFVLGWEIRRRDLATRWLETTRTLPVRVAAVGVFAAAAAVVALLPDVWRELTIRHWLFLDRAYAEIDDGLAWYDGGVRLAIMLVTITLIAAAFALVPRRRTWFTAWGSATMFIYLLHTFVLYWPRESGWLRSLAGEWWSTPLAIVGGVGIAMLLSTTPVRAATRWIVEPRLGWLQRREPDRVAATTRAPSTVTDGDAAR